METLIGFSIAGVVLLAALLWNYTRMGSIASASVAVAAFVAGMLFFTGSQQGFEVTPVNLAHLQVDEEPAEPLVLAGDIVITGFVLDDDAPGGREPIYFGNPNPDRFYDANNRGVELIAQHLDGTNFIGQLELSLATVQDGRIVDITTPVDIADGTGIWQGQPLVVEVGANYRLNEIGVSLTQSVRALYASEPMVLAGTGLGPVISYATSSDFSASAVLHTFNQYSDGNIAASELESREEIIAALEADGRFQQAVRDLCGFEPQEVTDITWRENDQERYQASFSGSGWVNATARIPVGQPVWVLVPQDDKGEECILNPPCGNPPPPPKETPTPTPPLTPTPTTPPDGQLKVVKFWDQDEDGVFDGDEQPLGGFTFKVTGPNGYINIFTIDNNPDLFNVPVGTYTVEEIDIPFGWRLSTGTNNPQIVTVEVLKPPAEAIFGNVQEKVTPSPTPSITPTPTPTPTPTQPPPLFFCSDFHEHGTVISLYEHPRMGTIQANRDVTWRVTVTPLGAEWLIHNETPREITIEVVGGAYVDVDVWTPEQGWQGTPCNITIPDPPPGSTTEPSRTPAPPTSTPSTPLPTPPQGPPA